MLFNTRHFTRLTEEHCSQPFEIPTGPGNSSTLPKEPVPVRKGDTRQGIVPPFPGNQFLQGKETPDGETIPFFLGNQFLQGKEKTSTHTHTPLPGKQLQFLQGKAKVNTLGTPEMYQTHQELIKRQGNKLERQYVELTPVTPVWVQHRQNTTWEPVTVISQCAPNSCSVSYTHLTLPTILRV